MLKIKRKFKGSKSKKKLFTYKGNLRRLSEDCSVEFYKSEKSGMIYSKCWKKKSYIQEYFTQQGNHPE